MSDRKHAQPLSAKTLGAFIAANQPADTDAEAARGRLLSDLGNAISAYAVKLCEAAGVDDAADQSIALQSAVCAHLADHRQGASIADTGLFKLGFGAAASRLGGRTAA